MRNVRKLLFVLVVMAPMPIGAQDSHYWTNQFGNRARLLGGAVVGSTRDVSAVYYNPGALALADEPELLLAGNVLELTRLELMARENEGDAVTTTTVRRLVVSPLSGVFRSRTLVRAAISSRGGRFAT